jgi:diketogulonate reductase-like aldo/keto reductase
MLILELAKKYEVKAGQIVLSFDLARNVGIIPKTSHHVRLRENF